MSRPPRRTRWFLASTEHTCATILNVFVIGASKERASSLRLLLTLCLLCSHPPASAAAAAPFAPSAAFTFAASSAREIHSLDERPLSEALASAVRGGLAGAGSMAVSVCALMWLRTTVNYQYRRGACEEGPPPTFLPSSKEAFLPFSHGPPAPASKRAASRPGGRPRGSCTPCAPPRLRHPRPGVGSFGPTKSTRLPSRHRHTTHAGTARASRRPSARSTTTAAAASAGSSASTAGSPPRSSRARSRASATRRPTPGR